MFPTPRYLADRARRSFKFRRLELASNYWQRRFSRTPVERYVNRPCNRTLPNVDVISFCGTAHLSLQTFSMLSFLRHVGTPDAWTVISDGSLDDDARVHLQKVCPTVRMGFWEDYLNDQNREAVELYSRKGGFAKKLAIVTGLRPSRPCIYIDTDIVFFSGGAHLQNLATTATKNYFLLDNILGLYPPLLTAAEQRLPPANAGFLIQVRPIPWQEPLDRLSRYLREHPEVYEDKAALHILEQTLCHIGYHLSGAEPLPKEYLLALDDAFEWGDWHLQPATVMRHYVVYTRMKMWLHARSYLP